jgi:hypothetical protein
MVNRSAPSRFGPKTLICWARLKSTDLVGVNLGDFYFAVMLLPKMKPNSKAPRT